THNSPLHSDAAQYTCLATNIAAGRGYVDRFPLLFLHPTAYRPPLYPAFLAVVYWALGPSVGLARLVNAVVGSVVVGLVFVLVRRQLSPRAGLWAALAVALSPNIVANDTFVLTEPLSLLLLVLVISSLLGSRWIAAGVLTGLLVLTRASAQYLAVVLAIWLFVRVGWRRALGYVSIVGLVVAPWVIRNQQRLGSFVFVTSNGFN